MKRLILLLSAVAVAGCGEKPAPPPAMKPPAPPPAAPKTAEFKSDPNGKNTCITCTLKTNEANCPKCKAPLKVAAAPAHKPTGDVGKSAISAVFACPEDKCTFTDARKGTCLKHSTTQLKEQWFVCDKCSKKEPVTGKCPGCSADLVRKLQ